MSECQESKGSAVGIGRSGGRDSGGFQGAVRVTEGALLVELRFKPVGRSISGHFRVFQGVFLDVPWIPESELRPGRAGFLEKREKLGIFQGISGRSSGISGHISAQFQ